MSIFQDPKKPWNALLNIFEEFAVGDGVPKNELFQPLHVFEVAPWLEFPDKPNYSLGKQAQHCNRVFVWGAYGDNLNPLYETGFRLDQNYRKFVRRVITELAKEVKPQLEDAEKEKVEALEKDIVILNREKDKLENNIEKAYEEHKETHPDSQISYDRFYDQHVLRKLIDRRLDDIIRKEEALLLLTADKLGDRLFLINEVDNELKSSFSQFLFPDLPVHEDNQNNWIKGYRQSIPADYTDFLEGSGGITYERTIEKSSSTSSTIETSWSGSAGIKIGWFRIGATAGGSTLDKETSSLTEKIKVKFKYLKVGFQRNDWFTTALFKEYYKQAPDFFTQTGFLSTIPMSVVLIKDIVIELESTEKNSKDIVNKFNGSGKIGIGPFNFNKGGGGFSKSEIIATASSEGNKLTITSDVASKKAYILGHFVLSPSLFSGDNRLSLLIANMNKINR